MLVTLGARTEASEDPIELLAACHGRIRKFLGLAQALGERPLPAAEALDVAGQVERYFRMAFPLHVEDEDRSVLPRLSGVSAEVDAALERMQREHRIIDPEVEALVARLAEIARAREVAEADRAAFRGQLPGLTAALEAHLTQEEQVLFPAARRVLDAPARAALRAELRARRQR